MAIVLVWAVAFPAYASSRAASTKLEPRCERLVELGAMIGAEE